MYTLDVEYSDLDRAIRNLELSEVELGARMAELAEDIGAQFIAKCAEESPRGDKWRAHDPRRAGPRFRDLWDYEVTPLGEDSTEVAIKNVHDAAATILLGRETPWEIAAKSAKGMSFPWESLGWRWATVARVARRVAGLLGRPTGWKWVHGAHTVTHPPQKGAMTHEKVLDIMQDEIEQKLSGVADRVAYIITRP